MAGDSPGAGSEDLDELARLEAKRDELMARDAAMREDPQQARARHDGTGVAAAPADAPGAAGAPLSGRERLDPDTGETVAEPAEPVEPGE